MVDRPKHSASTKRARTGGGRLRYEIVTALLFATISVHLGCAQGGAGLLGNAKQMGRSVEFLADDGDVAFRLLPVDSGVDIEDGSGSLIVSMKIGECLLDIEDSAGELLGRVSRPVESGAEYRVFGRDPLAVLFSLEQEPDGDLRVIDGKGDSLYLIKKRDYGFKLTGRNGQLESKIRIKEERISVREPTGLTFLSTRDPLSGEAAAALMLQEVPFEFAAGLAVAITRWGGGAASLSVENPIHPLRVCEIDPSEAEGGEIWDVPDGHSGLVGRRRDDERRSLILDLFAGRATSDQAARHFGVQVSTIERWREQALAGVGTALRQGAGESQQKLELEELPDALEQAFSSLANEHEPLSRVQRESDSQPGS